MCYGISRYKVNFIPTPTGSHGYTPEPTRHIFRHGKSGYTARYHKGPGKEQPAVSFTSQSYAIGIFPQNIFK